LSYSTIILDKAEAIATLTLNRPEKLNAFNPQMLEELLDALVHIEQDDDIRVLVIAGAGRAFSAGGDMEQLFLRSIEQRKHGEKGYDVIGWLVKARLLLRNMPQPVIASINGAAIGLGMTVSLACDLRIASEEAMLSVPFVRIGAVPEFGSTYSLPRLVGIAKACELIFTGKSITAKEAKEIGLVNEVVPASELKSATYEMAKSIAEAAPIAIRLAKKELYQGMDADLQNQLQLEYEGLVTTLQSEDHEEAVRAFLEKRKPIFKGK